MADVDEPKKGTPRNHDKEDAKLSREEYQLKKRLPRKLPRRPNDVYVNKKTNFKVCRLMTIANFVSYLAKCVFRYIPCGGGVLI